MKKLKKKKIYAFLTKNTVTYWTRLKTAELVETAKQLIRKNSCSLFEKSGNFFVHRGNVQIGLTTPSPCLFSYVLYRPPPSRTNVLFECPLLVQKVTAGKPNVSSRCNQKIFEIFSHMIYLLHIIYSYFFNRYNKISNKN